MSWLDGIIKQEFEQAPGDGEGQGGLACCSPWGCKESGMTEQLNYNIIIIIFILLKSAGKLL